MTTNIVALNSSYWDAGYLSTLGRGAGAIFLYAVVGLMLMLVGFYAIDLTTPGPLRKMVDAGKPNAIIVSAAGMVSMAGDLLVVGQAGGRPVRVSSLRVGGNRRAGADDADRDNGDRHRHAQVVRGQRVQLRVAHGGRRAVRARRRGGRRYPLTPRSAIGGTVDATSESASMVRGR